MRLRQGVMWLYCGAVVCLLSSPVGAAEGDTVSILDNLFLEAGGGVKRPAGDVTTEFGAVGFNWGIPLTPKSEDLGLGLQIGSDFSPRRGEDEWNGTAGFFGRNLKLGEEQVAGAVLVDYQRTTLRSTLWSLRPIAGITLGARDEVGVSGVIGLNRDGGTIFNGATVTTVREETPDSAEVFFNHYWTEKMTTELALGYQFSHIDEVMVRAQFIYGITRYVDVSVGGEVNGDGNYACGARVSFHFGGIGRHDSLNNIYAWRKQDFYTPFPMRGAGVGGGGGGLSSRPASKSVATGGGGVI